MLRKMIIISLIILLLAGCQLRPTPTPPISPLPSPVSPLPTPTSPVSPLVTPAEFAQQVAEPTETPSPSPTATSWHSGAVEVWCNDDAVPFSPLGLVSTQTVTLTLNIEAQIRQGDVLLVQGVPSYYTMQQFGPTYAPDEPCEGLFRRVEYDWRGLEDTADISGEVEEWLRLYWQPNPLTVTLYISDTNGEAWDVDDQPWAFSRGGIMVTPDADGYAFNRTFAWGDPTPTATPTRLYHVFLPVVLK